MPDPDKLINEAAGYISRQLDLPLEKIQVNADLKGLGMDSFRIIELVLFLERKTGLSFPDHAYTPQNLRSVESITNCFIKLKG